MEEQLKQLRSPKRSEQQQEHSFTQIQKKINHRQLFSKGQYALTITMSIAILFVLIWSFISTSTTENFEIISANETNIKTIYQFKNESTEPIVHIDKWYYPEKEKIRTEQQLLFLQFIGTELAQSQNYYTSNEWDAANMDFLLIRNDESKQYIQFYDKVDDDGFYYFAMDGTTKQFINLTTLQRKTFQTISSQYGGSLFSLLKIPLITLLGYLMVIFFVRFNLIQNTTEREDSEIKSFIRGILFIAYIILIRELSLYLFHAYHALFITAALITPFVLLNWRSFFKQNSPTKFSIWTVPIIALYLLFVQVIIKI